MFGPGLAGIASNRSGGSAASDVNVTTLLRAAPAARRRRNSRSSSRRDILIGLIRIVDAAAVILSAILTYRLANATSSPAISDLLLIGLVTICWMLFSFRSSVDVFDQFRADAAELVRIAVTWSAIMSSAVGAAYLMAAYEAPSRDWLINWGLVGLLSLGLSHLTFCLLVARWRRAGQLARRVAVVSCVADPYSVLSRLHWTSSDPCVVEVINAGGTVVGRGRDERAAFQKLAALCRTESVDEVVVVTPPAWVGDHSELANGLASLPVAVKLCHELPGFDFRPLPQSAASGAIMNVIYGAPLRGWGRLVKRLEDVALGASAVIAFAPVMLCVAAAIKLETAGPVFFCQKRYGLGHRTIDVLKFRTMYHSAEVPFRQATKNDGRVTRVGRFLRRSSLDELPQLFNVLVGEMSLVGPRPHPVMLDDTWSSAITGYVARHRVKPGITGWAQVNGYRGETDTDDKMRMRVALDVQYIENWSLIFDLAIVLKTLRVIFFHPNAY
jgi:Undecaprenyl-phosphate glucose phosphotransferase